MSEFEAVIKHRTVESKKMKPLVILISGKMGSGKTTAAKNVTELLKQSGLNICVIKFADPLYAMHREVLKVAQSYGMEVPVKDGRLLQLLGTEWGREVYGPCIWPELAKNRIEMMAKASEQQTVVIVEDCRFQSELEYFPEALKVRLLADRDVRKKRCDAWRDTETHQSEVDLDGHEDKFHLIVDTSTHEQAFTAQLIANEVTRMLNLEVKE